MQPNSKQSTSACILLRWIEIFNLSRRVPLQYESLKIIRREVNFNFDICEAYEDKNFNCNFVFGGDQNYNPIPCMDSIVFLSKSV